MKVKPPKPRDPSSGARTRGMLTTKVEPDKKKVIPRKEKHKGRDL